MRVMIIVIVSVFVLSCLAFGLLSAALVQTASDATAVAETGDSQRAVAVCIGVVNIGSCRVAQQHEQHETDSDGNPWPVIVLSIIMLLAAQWLVLREIDIWGAGNKR